MTIGDKTLEYGDIFKIKYQGRYAFRYLYTPDNSVCGYGPLTSQNKPHDGSQRRAFRIEEVII